MSLAGQVQEHGLAHIFREMGVPADQPQRGLVNQVNVPPHQLPKGRLRSGPHVFRQQCLAVRHLHSTNKTPPGAQNGQPFPGNPLRNRWHECR